MSLKFDPVSYNRDERMVYAENGRATEDFFIEQAIGKFQRYGQAEWLLWAIKEGLPGLLESDEGRELFARAIEGKLRQRGQSPVRNLKSDILKERILARVWFHAGRGLAVYNNPESGAQGESACEIAADEVGCSAAYAHQVWRDAGGHEPKTAQHQLAREFCMMEGKQQ